MQPGELFSTRRDFLKRAAAAGLALPFSALGADRIRGASEQVRLALLGCGGRGNSLVELVARLDSARVVAVCDPDTRRMDGTAAKLAKYEGNGAPDKVRDYRKLLERGDIDGVLIATPNHWHTLQSIEALQAGKAVYVEKPVSHTLWEGRQLIAAVKRHQGILTAGLQNRSDPGPGEGIAFVQQVGLGAIEEVHVCCFRNRNSIGRAPGGGLKVPESVDYNLWLGPAADVPLRRKKFHYDWHWVWNTGDGDVGNQAPHEIDLAYWLLGDRGSPASLESFGGRFGWDDAGETPNLHTAWCELNGKPLIIEVNDLWLSPKRNVPGMRERCRVGIIARCEKGILRGGRGGMTAYEPDGKTVIRKFRGDGGSGHMKNFIEAIRAGDGSRVAAPVESSVRSAEIAHLANLSIRAGSEVPAEALPEAADMGESLLTILKDQARQLNAWGEAQAPYTLGSEVKCDPATAAFSGEGVKPEWVRPPGRGDFEVPEIS